MKELTSVNNDIVKFVYSLSNKKFRDENSLFIAEGLKSLNEGLKFNYEIKYVFLLNDTKIPPQISDDLIYIVNDKVMKKISTTESIPPVLTVFRKRNISVENLNKYSKIVLLENIKDNGNLGTIIRSAAAFSIDAVILFGDCCDLYAPKTLRSSVGTFFQLPVLLVKDFSFLKENFSDFTYISTDLHKASDIEFKDIKDKFILMFGSEADGLSEKLSSLASHNTLLPLKSSVESLNLSTAVSIILYEISRN